MPKKFAGENSKAVAARQKKEASENAAKSKKEQAQEDAKWKDEDKKLLKQRQKKEEQEKKRLEQLQKKAESKALLEEEMNSFKKVSKPAPPSKATRAQIDKTTNVTSKQAVEKKIETHLDKPVEENINRVMVEGEEARSVIEAITILSVNDEATDKHPEKRMKAAYTAYEERRLAELKMERPSLRLSQLKQMIFKDWQKSPENPLNKVQ